MMGFRRAVLAALFALCGAGAVQAAAVAPLAQTPTVSRSQVVFTYGGYLWSVPRAGGQARRLTNGGHEGRAFFSPDGRWLAYSTEIAGNSDVYVMPAAGGAPRRLTWHPGSDVAVGWAPDSKRVLLASSRDAYARFHRLYTVPRGGGWQEPSPMWRGESGSYSPDESRIAYVPNDKTQKDWKRYRGGQTTPIYLLRLRDLQLEKIPRQNSNDFDPAWVGDTVYFLSDRNGPVTLFAYDTKTKIVRQVVENTGLDFKALSAGPDTLAYEQFGDVYLVSLRDGVPRKLDIRIPETPPGTQPTLVKLANAVRNPALSPTGAQVAFEARGDIILASADRAAARDLTSTSGAAERSPAWSPDGKWLAYLSDEAGEYALHLRDFTDPATVHKISLGDPPSYFEAPRWSPDSRRILLQDRRLNLWCVDIATGAAIKVDTATYREDFATAWSPDSQWIAYSKLLPNQFQGIFLYSLASGRSVQVTDGMSDARYPVFDRSGDKLLFAASTDLALSMSGREISALFHPITRTIYALDLRRDGATAAGEAKSIDPEGFRARITALPLPARNYVGLQAGEPGSLFLQELPLVSSRRPGAEPATVSKADLRTGAVAPILTGVTNFQLSADGEKALYRRGRTWFVISVKEPARAGEGALDLSGLEVRVDPRAEWGQIYREVWREERDFFYDPNFHGLDLAAAEAKYAPYLQRLGSRQDLDDLIWEMLSDLTVGHLFVAGPPPSLSGGERIGLLGADYAVDHGHIRFTRVFDGGDWNPDLKAPLAGQALAGDYLLAVNGRALDASGDIYQAFAGTADKPTRIKLGSRPDGSGAREITVTPVADEAELRSQAWQEDNRRRVDALSGGRVAYVYLPDTLERGYRNFNRYYFAQTDRQAAILDDRYNGGGRFPDYIVDLLERPRRMCSAGREERDTCMPLAQIDGPKTMIINEMAISGGEALAWMFRRDRVGSLVGTRTWGGLVAADGLGLIDGGSARSPSPGFYDAAGQWIVENRGVAPDIEVENDPASVAAGRDPQLDKAVEVTLEALKVAPPKPPVHPAYPVYRRP